MSQMTTDQRPPEYLRADAARNLHRIVEVAARMLGDDPHVGMAAVAEAADVSRATVYRHFPTREALMDAIRTQALAAGAQAIVECRLEEGGATEALRRLVEAWLDIARALRLRPARRSRRQPARRSGPRASAPRRSASR